MRYAKKTARSGDLVIFRANEPMTSSDFRDAQELCRHVVRRTGVYACLVTRTLDVHVVRRSHARRKGVTPRWAR